MKSLKEFGLNETILCEGWVQSVFNSQTQTLKVDIEIKTKGMVGRLITFVNANHPLFNYLRNGEDRFYARVQTVVTGRYNEQYQNLKVNLLQVEPIAYIEQPSVNIEDLVKRLKAHLKGFKNKELYALCRSVLVADEEFRNQVFNAPSHEKQAYCYRGGLLQHIVRLMDLIDYFLPGLARNHFLDYQTGEMDSDLLKTAALYHDLGVAKALKISEKNKIERTLEGDLIGSPAMSIEILTEMLMRTPLSNPYLAINLRGIVASSKADIEESNGNGSRILPKTKEAVFFANLERIEFQDARFQTLERELVEPEMVRHYGSLYVVPNQMIESEVEIISIPSTQTPTEEVVATKSDEVLTPLEEVVSQNEEMVDEGLSFLTPLEPINLTGTEEPLVVGVVDSEPIISTTGEPVVLNPIEPMAVEHPKTNSVPNLGEHMINSIIEEVDSFDETLSNPTNEQPTISVVNEHPQNNGFPQMTNQLEPIYNQSNDLNLYANQTGLNPYENTTGVNPYMNQGTFNPYTQPVDPESGMPIESMYSMEYVEGAPLDIPSVWPETPSTRPNIKK